MQFRSCGDVFPTKTGSWSKKNDTFLFKIMSSLILWLVSLIVQYLGLLKRARRFILCCALIWRFNVKIYTAAQTFVISKIFNVFKEVSSAHQGCIYMIKNTEILLQFKITVFYVNMC